MADNETTRDERNAVDVEAIRERHERATRGFWFAGNRSATFHAHDHEGTMRSATLFADSLADVQAVTHAWQDIENLLAENAALREIVKQVANGPRWTFIPPFYICNFCDVEIAGIFGRTDHRSNCPVAKARALLATVSNGHS